MILQISLMKDALYDMVSKLFKTVPNVVMAVVIFIVGIIISKIVAKVIKKTLEKIGIDKIGEKLNEIDIVQKANMEIKISSVLSKIIYYFLMLLFAVAATSVLGIPEISQLFADIFNFIPRLIVALIVLVLGTLIADAFAINSLFFPLLYSNCRYRSGDMSGQDLRSFLRDVNHMLKVS